MEKPARAPRGTSTGGRTRDGGGPQGRRPPPQVDLQGPTFQYATPALAALVFTDSKTRLSKESFFSDALLVT